MYPPFNHTLFPNAGQRRLQPARPLSIIIPVQDRPEPNLSPAFNGSDLRPRAHARTQRRTTTANAVSQFYDTDSDDTEDEWDNQAQYLTLSPNSPYYHHHPSIRTPALPAPDFGEESSRSFSRDAMNDEIDTVAQGFHDEIERLAPGLGETKFDRDCLKGLESELVDSPIRLFEDTFFQTLRRRVDSALPPFRAPENFPPPEESDSSDEDGEICLGDTEDEDESETEEDVTPSWRRNPYNLDLRLVAPFNDGEAERNEEQAPKYNSPLRSFRKKRH